MWEKSNDFMENVNTSYPNVHSQIIRKYNIFIYFNLLLMRSYYSATEWKS